MAPRLKALGWHLNAKYQTANSELETGLPGCVTAAGPMLTTTHTLTESKLHRTQCVVHECKGQPCLCGSSSSTSTNQQPAWTATRCNPLEPPWLQHTDLAGLRGWAVLKYLFTAS
jgi:hypothetical protein